MENLLQVTGCSAELQSPSCQTDCLSERYRSITGECNNRSELSLTLCTCSGKAVLFQIDFVVVLLLILVNIFCLFLFRQQPRWGAANIPYSRWLPPEYEDVWGAPRGWDPEHTYNNASLPPVRVLQQHSVVHSPAGFSNSHHPSLCLLSRCGWCLRRCCSLITTTSLWTPLCLTCWWSGVSGLTMTWC